MRALLKGHCAAFMDAHARSITWALVFVVVVLLLLQGGVPEWFAHWHTDIGNYFNRSSVFMEQHTWSGLGRNEYPPGSLWYFVLIRSLIPHADQYNEFLVAFMFVNAFLIVLHASFFLRYGHRWSAPMFLAIVAAFGPSLLFRIELPMSLLVLVSWQLLRENKVPFAAFVLGLATSIKVYPIVLLPLVLLECARLRRYGTLAESVMHYAIGILLPVVLFTAYGGTLQQIFESLNAHALDPIGLEGFWGAVVTMLQAALDIPLEVTSVFITGIRSDLPFLSESVIDVLWLVICAVAVAVVVRVRWRRGLTDAGLAFILLLTFVFFAESPNPQYFWWALSILPFVPFSWQSGRAWIGMTVAVMLALVLAQIVYPVYYNPFYDWFYGRGGPLWTFVITVIRNILYAGVLLMMLWRMFRPRRS